MRLVKLLEKKNFGDIPQRDFAHISFEPTEAQKFSMVYVEGLDKEDWFAKVLLPIYLRTTENENTSWQLSFIQHFKTTSQLDAVDKTLNYISLRCATDSERDHTLDMRGMATNKVEVEEWSGVITFTLIVSLYHIVLSNYCVAPFTPALAWPFQRFDVNRFLQSRL